MTDQHYERLLLFDGFQKGGGRSSYIPQWASEINQRIQEGKSDTGLRRLLAGDRIDETLNCFKDMVK